MLGLLLQPEAERAVVVVLEVEPVVVLAAQAVELEAERAVVVVLEVEPVVVLAAQAEVLAIPAVVQALQTGIQRNMQKPYL